MADPALEVRPKPLADEPGPGRPACLRFYRKLAAGVTVVTAPGRDGPVGMTASSVTSVSLQPPLVLVCLADDSATLRAVRTNGAFAVHLLRDDQQTLAETFARRGVAKFDGLTVRNVLSVPILADVLGWVVCLLEDERRYGDHNVVVGRIVASHVGPGQPLLWHDSGFVTLSKAAVIFGPQLDRFLSIVVNTYAALCRHFDPAAAPAMRTCYEAVLS
jgi:flavin reductase (DIM6/NTAB) family NADH-FMN oxidoreductase RutF